MKKLRVIDYVIIVAIIAVISIFVVRKMNTKYETLGEDVEASMEETMLTYKVSGVRMFSVDAIHVGDVIYDDDRGVEIGTVADLNTEPTWHYIVKNNNERVKAEQTGYYELYVTVKSKMAEQENKYIGNEKMELKINSTVKLATRNVAFVGSLVNFGEYVEGL